MATKKAQSPKSVELKVSLNKRWLSLVIAGIIILAAGFGGGILYQRHQDENSKGTPTTMPGICNCPNIPVNTDALRDCRC